MSKCSRICVLTQLVLFGCCDRNLKMALVCAEVCIVGVGVQIFSYKPHHHRCCHHHHHLFVTPVACVLDVTRTVVSSSSLSSVCDTSNLCFGCHKERGIIFTTIIIFIITVYNNTVQQYFTDPYKGNSVVYVVMPITCFSGWQEECDQQFFYDMSSRSREERGRKRRGQNDRGSRGHHHDRGGRGEKEPRKSSRFPNSLS